jgi:trk system potassium uptake protein TrkA
VVEGIQEMDAFISVTEDEESNIISCLMAKHLEVKKTVALVSKTQYVPLSQTIGIDAIVNVKASASDEIHRQIRQGMMLTVKALQGIKAEIIEVIADKNCKMLDVPIRDLSLPEGVVLGGILHNGDVEIAIGDSIIQQGDRVIILALPRAIEKVDQLFS